MKTDPQNQTRPQGVFYCRQSTCLDEASIPEQREQVRDWAERHGVEIIHEFTDSPAGALTPADLPR